MKKDHKMEGKKSKGRRDRIEMKNKGREKKKEGEKGRKKKKENRGSEKVGKVGKS